MMRKITRDRIKKSKRQKETTAISARWRPDIDPLDVPNIANSIATSKEQKNSKKKKVQFRNSPSHGERTQLIPEPDSGASRGVPPPGPANAIDDAQVFTGRSNYVAVVLSSVARSIPVNKAKKRARSIILHRTVDLKRSISPRSDDA